MPLAFILLLLLGLVILWFLLAFLYRPLGKLTKKIYNDSIKEINKEDDEKENVENE